MWDLERVVTRSQGEIISQARKNTLEWRDQWEPLVSNQWRESQKRNKKGRKRRVGQIQRRVRIMHVMALCIESKTWSINSIGPMTAIWKHIIGLSVTRAFGSRLLYFLLTINEMKSESSHLVVSSLSDLYSHANHHPWVFQTKIAEWELLSYSPFILSHNTWKTIDTCCLLAQGAIKEFIEYCFLRWGLGTPEEGGDQGR